MVSRGAGRAAHRWNVTLLRAMLLLATMLFALLCCTGATRERTHEPLRRVQRGFDAWLLEARPDLATRYGLPHAETRLEPVTALSLATARATLSPLRDSLVHIERGALGPRGAAAYDSLAARIEREWSAIERDTWTREPAAYVPLTVGAVLDVALAPRVTPCERARRALKRLRRVPEVLRAAQVQLRSAHDFDRERTLAAWDAGLLALRADAPAAVQGCREPGRNADFVEADSLALDAIVRFVRYVREDLTQTARAR